VTLARKPRLPRAVPEHLGGNDTVSRASLPSRTGPPTIQDSTSCNTAGRRSSPRDRRRRSAGYEVRGELGRGGRESVPGGEDRHKPPGRVPDDSGRPATPAQWRENGSGKTEARSHGCSIRASCRCITWRGDGWARFLELVICVRGAGNAGLTARQWMPAEFRATGSRQWAARSPLHLRKSLVTVI